MSKQKIYVVDLSAIVSDAQLENAIRALKRSVPDKVVFKHRDNATEQKAVNEIAACGISTEVVGIDWKPSSDHIQISLH